MIEDGYCRFAADAYGCAVGANITDGKTILTYPGFGLNVPSL